MKSFKEFLIQKGQMVPKPTQAQTVAKNPAQKKPCSPMTSSTCVPDKKEADNKPKPSTINQSVNTTSATNTGLQVQNLKL